MFQSRKGTSGFTGGHKGPGRGRDLGSLSKLVVKMRLAFRSVLFLGCHCSCTDRPRGLAQIRVILVASGFSSHSFSSMEPGWAHLSDVKSNSKQFMKGRCLRSKNVPWVGKVLFSFTKIQSLKSDN